MKKPVIILADDEKTVLESLLNQLKTNLGNNYQYEIIQTIEEGKEVVNELLDQNRTIALIISDWLVPPEISENFLKDITARDANIPIIMLSGYADDDSVKRAFLLSNLKYFIRKPWDEDDLIEKIKTLLNKL